MAEQLEKKKRTRTTPIREAKKPVSRTIKTKDIGLDDSYEIDDRMYPANNLTVDSVSTVPELVALLESNKDIDIEARVFCVKKGTGVAQTVVMGKDQFIESYKKNSKTTRFREAVDTFAMDTDGYGNGVGKDSIPLLGGPFNKQLYLYNYLKMHSQAFFAYNHDPIAKTAVEIIRDFTLGRGWRVDCDNKAALALWRSFEDVNDLYLMMDHFVKEISVYGEQFIWWLPNNEVNIAYQVAPEQAAKKGLLPRVRLIDPSVIWEIVTYPEDITRVLYYQWVAPTQYQIYSGSDKGRPVASTKFIYQQLPPDQVQHYKINCSSNEKRGRSDLFPVLSYLKRLRDSVNYSIIGMQKSSSWSMDTEIDGNQEDIERYISSQQDIGTIPPPGSEFVHSTKIKRSYLSNDGASRGGQSQAFDWSFSMICAGLGIPQQYFGTHLSGGSTRASAIVATEPVAKKFEMRQLLVERALQNMAKKLFKMYGIEDCEIEVTFPEVVTQDRSTKMKDISMAENMGWISHERAAEIVAKELGLTKYDWETEKVAIEVRDKKDQIAQGTISPLTSKGQTTQHSITSDQKKDINDSRGY